MQGHISVPLFEYLPMDDEVLALVNIAIEGRFVYGQNRRFSVISPHYEDRTPALLHLF